MTLWVGRTAVRTAMPSKIATGMPDKGTSVTAEIVAARLKPEKAVAAANATPGSRDVSFFGAGCCCCAANGSLRSALTVVGAGLVWFVALSSSLSSWLLELPLVEKNDTRTDRRRKGWSSSLNDLVVSKIIDEDDDDDEAECSLIR